jgi:large subunit ribosomal protein L18
VLKDKTIVKQQKKLKLRRRIRARIRGTAERPRLHVFKSNRYVYAQAIDDVSGRVLAAAATIEKAFREKSKDSKNKKACEVLGGLMALKLKDKGIRKVVFDRGIYPYHGKVKTLAEALRSQGVEF